MTGGRLSGLARTKNSKPSPLASLRAGSWNEPTSRTDRFGLIVGGAPDPDDAEKSVCSNGASCLNSHPLEDCIIFIFAYHNRDIRRNTIAYCLIPSVTLLTLPLPYSHMVALGTLSLNMGLYVTRLFPFLPIFVNFHSPMTLPNIPIHKAYFAQLHSYNSCQRHLIGELKAASYYLEIIRLPRGPLAIRQRPKGLRIGEYQRQRLRVGFSEHDKDDCDEYSIDGVWMSRRTIGQNWHLHDEREKAILFFYFLVSCSSVICRHPREVTRCRFPSPEKTEIFCVGRTAPFRTSFHPFSKDRGQRLSYQDTSP
ncbi:hypothetical protein K449DRAFT_429817 [Hypoxylon sp. EC38]|nr:hypothetical protein K449DRAFT_429817 [Hypoxylon sp. EC38]